MKQQHIRLRWSKDGQYHDLYDSNRTTHATVHRNEKGDWVWKTMPFSLIPTKISEPYRRQVDAKRDCLDRKSTRLNSSHRT